MSRRLGQASTCRKVAPDSLEAQRRFLAYAAHELRGGITVQVALTEATLSDPNADTVALREMGEQVLAACWRQERLLTALLTLTRTRARTSATEAR